MFLCNRETYQKNANFNLQHYQYFPHKKTTQMFSHSISIHIFAKQMTPLQYRKVKYLRLLLHSVTMRKLSSLVCDVSGHKKLGPVYLRCWNPPQVVLENSGLVQNFRYPLWRLRTRPWSFGIVERKYSVDWS